MGYTPMIQQYLEIKAQHQDAIVFFRLGDFYEMFFEDAIEASEVLEIALTARGGNKDKIPMCGVPHHAYEGYAAKLLLKGYKVALCEQVEDVSEAKGIVRREVIRVITPGTVMDEKILADKANNYLVGIYGQKDAWGLAWVDISTGEFKMTESPQGKNSIIEEINRLQPTECLITDNLKQSLPLVDALKQLGCIINWRPLPEIDSKEGLNFLMDELGQSKLEKKELENWPFAIMAAYLVLGFLRETQKQKLGHLIQLETYKPNQYMLLDGATRRNLELTENLRTHSMQGSLLGVMDSTMTSMGARKIRQWIETPLLNLSDISERQDAVEELMQSASLREGLRKAIKGIYDLERLLGRISYGTANARDLVALKQSVGRLPKIALVLGSTTSQKLSSYFRQLDLLEDIHTLLDKAIVEEPPTGLRDGNIIKDGFHPEADNLREAARNGKQWIAELESQERERTGIRSLKIGFNKVFGYFLEITRANLSLVPPEYQRKQTLANAERFITPELKEKEGLILGAEERLNNLEYHLFQQVRLQIEEAAIRIQQTAHIIAELDVFLSLAVIAISNNYCKPELRDSIELELLGARHPVVEQLSEDRFVANDYYLKPPNNILNIITGPNMAGKSTYIRTAALITIMAQVGSFVPADKAIIGIVDRVFARVGASDDLSSGQSTFMVEMNEVANILNNATISSFVILDEVGRGTSTFDGISIAWAVSEHIVHVLKARTLFATHYHELNELQHEWPSVSNFKMAVKEEGNKITFLRKVVPGGADRSYGIHVAELAGLPETVIDNAYHILATLEKDKGNLEAREKAAPCMEKEPSSQEALKPFIKEFFNRLVQVDLDQLAPIEAWHFLASLCSEAELLKERL